MAARKLPKKTREALEALFDELVAVPDGKKQSRLSDWIEKTAKKNPARAAELALAIAEYCTPKMARVESAGGTDSTLRVIIRKEGEPLPPTVLP